MSKIYTSADQLIGHTPLLELTHIEKDADLSAKLLAKLEYFNPAGVFAAKSAGFICRKMGRQGVTWAGKIALKINPDILEDLSSQVRKKIFVTCGTNGKTTTNNMLCAALENEGQKVVCNHTGSNMLNGVVAAFVLAAGPTGRLDADYACIEVDEASTRHVFPGLKPDYMLLTNLFRDQLDRYGEIDITMNILEEMIRTVPNASRCGFSPYKISRRTVRSCEHDSQFFLKFCMALNNCKKK